MTPSTRACETSQASVFRLDGERTAGLLTVIVIHMGLLYGLLTYRLIPSPVETATLFVNFIAQPAPERTEPKAPPPKPVVKEKPRPQQLVAEAPVLAPTDYVAPPLPPLAAQNIQAPQTPLPPGPVSLGSELSLACPERTAPTYPAISRRLGETGQVVLRVELSETGSVAQVKIDKSSGYGRLDEVAVAAVRSWHCTPATRNGQPVRAVALQPFNFILQGN